MKFAAGKLKDMKWEVRRSITDPDRVTVSGDDISHLLFLPLPPTTGSAISYALTLVVQALSAKAESLTPPMIEQIASRIGEQDPLMRDHLVLQACREYLITHIVAVAQHGALGRNGTHLPGPQALLDIVGVEIPSEPVRPTSQTVPRGGTPATSRPAFHVSSEAPLIATLTKAWKYLKSSSLGLHVELRSAHPLSLELMPGEGFQKRFDDILSGSHEKEDEAARALVLKAMIDVVKNADEAGLRVWLPTIDAGLLLTPSRQAEVLLSYQSRLFAETRAVIQSTGHLGLRTFPNAAYADLSVLDL